MKLTVTTKLVTYKHSSWFAELRFPEASRDRAHVCSSERKRIKHVFGATELLGNTGPVFESKWPNRVTAQLFSLMKTPVVGLPPLSVRSAVTDPYRHLQGP